ncbi:hypothetical protein [Burkholderia pseudomallei]|uniref:hypothetical protein n=1 Tax=Burkholderia pseudomallei TaxID=28450 RepID=UPI00100B0907|nr:hypothetical protein [Burkholderia pseudomallei]
MSTISVQFADSTQAAVVSYFSGPQNATTFPYQGQIDTHDARYSTFFASIPVALRTGMPIPT